MEEVEVLGIEEDNMVGPIFLFMTGSLLKLTCILATESKGIAPGESLASPGESLDIPAAHPHHLHG